jgi:bifunctional ADP-heptose synthase (sugar kinase/adenylyltransferase)
VRGGDGHGYELGQALARAGIDASLMIEAPVATFTYTKLLNSGSGEEDRGRIDYVNPDPLPAGAARAVVEQLLAHAAGFDVILVSDQAETRHEGVVTSEVREALARLGHPLVWVDSRMRAELFRGVLVKPNEREAQEACTRLGVSGYRALREVIGYPRLFVTHGDRGVLVLDGESETWVSTRAVQKPVDICGAGDSFSAGAALALAAGATPVEAARFGNLVTSITIMKKGTGTASPAEVMQAAARIAEQGPHP